MKHDIIYTLRTLADYLEENKCTIKDVKREIEILFGVNLPDDWWSDERYVHLQNAHYNQVLDLIWEYYYEDNGTVRTGRMQEIVNKMKNNIDNT